MRYVNEKQPIPEFITNFDEACDFCNYAGERYDQIVKNSISNIKRKYYIETGCQIITEENIFVTIKNKIVNLIQKFIELLKNLFEKFIGFFKKKKKSDESDSSSSSGSSSTSSNSGSSTNGTSLATRQNGNADLAAHQSNNYSSGSSTDSTHQSNNNNNINSVQLVDHPIPKNVLTQPIEKWVVSDPTVNAFNDIVSSCFENFKLVAHGYTQFKNGDYAAADKTADKMIDSTNEKAFEKIINKIKTIKNYEEIYTEEEGPKIDKISDFINKHFCGDELPASEITYGKVKQYYKIIDNNVYSQKAINVANGIYKNRDAQLKRVKHMFESFSNKENEASEHDTFKELIDYVSKTLKLNQAVFSGILKGIETYSLYAAQIKIAFKRAEKGMNPIRKNSAA